jgi:dipeptidyl aminopeptidase/acylaminoacyl peptidase
MIPNRLARIFHLAFFPGLVISALAETSPDTATFRLQTWPAGEARSVGARPAAADGAGEDPVSAYIQVRSASFAAWDGAGGIYVGTRLGVYPQAYRVAAPLADRRQATFFTKRISASYFNPAPERAEMLFTSDEGGNEQFRLGIFDFKTGTSRLLRCPPGRVDDVVWNDSGTAFAYAHTPEGADRWDLRLGRPDGRDTLLYSGPGSWEPLDLSPDGKFLLARKYISASESQLYLLSLEGGTVTRLLPNEGPQSFGDAKWVKDGRTLCFVSDREGEFARLYLLRLGEEKPVLLSRPAPWDVEWVSVSRERNALVYSLNEEGVSRLFAVTPGEGKPRALPGLPRGIIDGAHFRRGGHEFGFTVNSAVFPGDAFTYDLRGGKAVRWTKSETGGLPPGSFREPELVKYPTFDSTGGKPRLISAWLYKPAGPAGGFPVVVQIHGGPEQQARPGFDAFVQYALGRGMAVIAPNVRGSSGYGKSYLAADDGRKRMHSVRDVGALLDWIGARPDLDARRVAVIGRSYGGFMALASLIAYGDRLKAGVSTVGITHFPTFLKNTSGYRRDLRRVEYGDERDPAMAAFLDSISPLTRMDRIKSPLLLCHGRNDPRVPFEESERIFSALQSRSVPVWFLSFRDEGHAFRDDASRTAYYRVIGEFLSRYLRP